MKRHCYRFSEEPIDPHFDPNLSQDLVILPFAQIDSVDDAIWPKRKKYVVKLLKKYKDHPSQDLGSFPFEEDKQDDECITKGEGIQRESQSMKTKKLDLLPFA
jgi:hypothetical protein